MTVRLLAHLPQGLWLAVAPSSTPPSDPLGSVVQNPDDVREAACRLVESQQVCSPPSVPATVPRQPVSSGGAGGFFGVVLWGLLIAAVVALAFVAYRYLQDRAPRSEVAGGDGEEPDADAQAGSVVIDRRREPGGWREEADAHRAAGRYRDALRCRYRALVGDLARRGLLDEIPGRTTGEERRELRSSSPAAEPLFGQAADLFDTAWYGGLDVQPSDDDHFQQLDHAVLAQATPAGRPGTRERHPDHGTTR